MWIPSNIRRQRGRLHRVMVVASATTLVLASQTAAQQFDFDLLIERVRGFSVVVDMKFEVSFGVHTSEQQERFLGTIVTNDGLVLFNGAAFGSDDAISTVSGFAVKTTPTRIEIETMDGRTFDGEYVGVERFTKIGFVRIQHEGSVTFPAVEFKKDASLMVGDWLALYMLLPEFISPALAADVGMVSTLVESPEPFALTVGFNTLQMTSVLFNDKAEPVGVLGALIDPSAANHDAGGLLQSFGDFGMPLLGVLSGDRLEVLIADPPQKGETDRGWLGITLQALTKEMAEFWDLDISGGIIVNEIIKNSPADKSGLAVGDIIFEVNGEPVTVDRDENLSIFQRHIAELGPKASVEFSILRRKDDKTVSLSLPAVLDEAPMAATDAPEYESESLEFKVRNLVFGDYMRFNQDPDSFRGVIVSELEPGGLANVGGLRFGDVIERVGDDSTTSVEDFETVMQRLEKAKSSEVIFFIWRNKKTLFVNIKTDWD